VVVAMMMVVVLVVVVVVIMVRTLHLKPRLVSHTFQIVPSDVAISSSNNRKAEDCAASKMVECYAVSTGK